MNEGMESGDRQSVANCKHKKLNLVMNLRPERGINVKILTRKWNLGRDLEGIFLRQKVPSGVCTLSKTQSASSINVFVTIISSPSKLSNSRVIKLMAGA